MKVCLRCNHTFTSSDWACHACGYAPDRLNGFEAHAPEFAHDGGGFRAEYFSKLAELEAANFWFRARNRLIAWALCKYQPMLHSFLEVGCGTGFALSGIADSRPNVMLSGSEIFIAGLPYAASRVPAAQFMQMDARRIPFMAEFDAIGAFDVLEHIEADELVLAQLHQALRPGGLLLLTVPQHPWLWSAADDYACHVRRYTATDIRDKLTGNGFNIVRSSSFVTILLPIMLLSRLWRKEVNDDYDPLAELRLPTALNILFFSFMCVEQFFIQLGVNLPVGGSRLIVAKKVG